MAILVLHVACSLAFIYVLFSHVEFVTHRYLMHSMRTAQRLGIEFLHTLCKNHMSKHHKRGYRHDTDEKDDHLSHILIAAACVGLPISPIVWYIDPLTVYLSVGFAVVYSIGWWLVHLEMHRNQGRIFARNAIFRYLERRHQLHHHYSNTHFNVLLPLCDWLYGTHQVQSERLSLRRRKALAAE